MKAFARTSAASVALALATLRAGSAPTPRMPGPATDRYERSTRAEDDARCVRCHASTATTHDASLHRASFSDPSFQKGFALEPAPFCQGCHAPEAKPTSVVDAFARTRGVTCVTCHQPKTGDAVLAGPARGDRGKAPHPLARTADFGTRACAGCHEFSFPHAEAKGERGLMQKTMREHAASTSTSTSCAGCHMKAGDHGAATSRDPALLRRSLSVGVTRADGGPITFTLDAVGVGHAFPTGDLFRRLVLRVHVPGGVVERALGRTFTSVTEGDAVVRLESTDVRLAPSRKVVVDAPEATRWEVVYQRVTAVGQTPPFATRVEDETLLASGAFTAPAGSSRARPASSGGRSGW